MNSTVAYAHIINFSPLKNSLSYYMSCRGNSKAIVDTLLTHSLRLSEYKPLSRSK